jgi:hypothetical protein
LQARLEKCKDRICKIPEFFGIFFYLFDFSKAKDGKNPRKSSIRPKKVPLIALIPKNRE